MKSQFAIVEIMGHRSHAGVCSEVEMFGGKMLEIITPGLPEVAESSRTATRRTDVCDPDFGWQERVETGRYVTAAKPAVPSGPLYYGAASIFSLTPCTMEETMAHAESQRPYTREEWVPDLLALPAGPETDDESPDGEFDADEREKVHREFFGDHGADVVKVMVTVAGSTKKATLFEAQSVQEAIDGMFEQGKKPAITFPEPEQDEYDVWFTSGEVISAMGSLEAVKAWRESIKQASADVDTDEAAPDRWANEGGAI